MPTFVSFNINSIRSRIHQLEAIKSTLLPDIIGLQETKVQDKDFPLGQIQALGYHCEIFGQKTHYGVAILSKQPPIFVQKGFVGDDDDAQKRFIHARFDIDGKQIDVLNGYFPQGENQDHPTKYPMKRKYYADLTAYIAHLISEGRHLIVMGDMNVAPLDTDVGIGEANAKRWLKKGACSFLKQERDWYAALMQTGLVDTYRHLVPTCNDDTGYSWFDYRSKGFDDTPKRGLRIDHILATPTLIKTLTGAGIDYTIRAMERPSDHAPVWASFDFNR